MAPASSQTQAAAESFYAGDFAKAAALAQAALKSKRSPEAYGILAAAFHAQGEVEQAITAYREGVGRFPDNATLAVNFARHLRGVAGHGAEAVEILRRVVSRQPRLAAARLTLVETLRLLNHATEAEDAARSYVKDFGDDPKGYLSLALALFNTGKLTEALASADRNIAMGGDTLRAMELKANIFVNLGDAAQTLQCYRDIIAVSPDPEFHSRVLMSMQYCDHVHETEMLSEAKAWASIHTTAIKPRTTWPNIVFDPERPLTVGFVSRDFRLCSTLHLARPLFEHFPDNWTVKFYGNVEIADAVTETFRDLCDDWADIGVLDDNAAAAMITADTVDVLVDLNGHTLGGRLGVFARKPAPIQVAWLDYVGTTGLSCMDAIIGDAGHLPLTDQPLYVEPIRHVADNLYRYAPPSEVPAVAPLPAARNGFVTFGCFNSAYKLSPTSIRRWSDVLRIVPSARMLLNSPQYQHDDTRQRFLTMFADHGIAPERIIFQNGAAAPFGMLQVYDEVDIALDPFPYSGGLTTIEGLYMGVPVVTLPGARFGSRHSSVHLRCVGLNDWIAADNEDYVALARAKAADLTALAKLRGGLRDRVVSSPLMDGARFASGFTAVLRDLWREACARNR